MFVDGAIVNKYLRNQLILSEVRVLLILKTSFRCCCKFVIIN